MEQYFKTHISSEDKLLDLHIRETLDYRDLIFLFVKRNFTTQYKQTILGPLWAIIQPLITTLVFTIVFGNLAGLTTADISGNFIIPSFLFYMSGNICWGYLSSTLQATSNTFLDNRATMGKVYYPRLVAPIATAFSRLISFGIQFLLLMGIWILFWLRGGTSIRLSLWILIIPLLIIHMMILAVGLGIIISSVTTKYRDLAMLVGFGLELWRYGCPIAYGLQLVPERYKGLYMINPVTPILTTFRYALFGFGYLNLWYYVLSLILSCFVFLIGLIMFSHIERTFMDTI
ncbi:MAG: ABC transporter permease [Oscillospiraceae bacterium]|nr:ABC transporter permease [Oscillospiraceae bacterium]